MIHVAFHPEPASFDEKVRQKGIAWLQKKKIDLSQPLPSQTKLEPYWRNCLADMHERYNGCCAYLAIFFERVTGGGTVDHFVAKSRRPDLAYEWRNYRLACSRMNSRKRDYDDVLDPFEVKTGWFQLELVSGRIFPNPQLPDAQQEAVQTTIDRLGLDDAGNREMRARHYQDYCKKCYTENFLRVHSPFVWTEVNRQGLL